jgi:hypothetical protein
VPRLSRSVITGAAIPSKTGVALLARLRGGGALLTQASLTSISYTVSDVTLGTTLGTGTFTVASSIFDVLQQTDPRWTADSAAQPGADGAFGYNFLAVLPATLFPLTAILPPSSPLALPTADRIQADVTYTLASGEPFRVTWQWLQLPTYG